MDTMIGHNNPPDAIEALRAALAETHGPLLKRSADLAAMAERLPKTCEDEDTAGKLADAIKSCAAFTKNAEATRVDAKEPHLAAGRTVDGFFKKMMEPVDAVKRRMNALHTEFNVKKADAERRRREAEAEVARKAAEDAERAARDAKSLDDAIAAEALAQAARTAATVKNADLSRTRTELGVVASLRTTWVHALEDPALVPRAYLAVDEGAIRVAIKAATTADGKCPLTIPGVRIYARAESVIR